MTLPVARAWALALAVGLLGQAASASELPQLNTLVTPDAPAFVVLGLSPTEIQRPTDPVAVATSLGDAFLGDLGRLKVPTNLALEVAPYWLVPRRELTLAEYQRGSAASLYRKLSISLASATRTPTDGSAPTPRLGFGLRTRVLDGQPEDFGECQGILNQFAIKLGQYMVDHPPANEAEANQLQQQFMKENEPALSSAMREKRCIETASARKGLVMDLALAGVADFTSDALSSGSLSNLSGWLSVSYLARELSLVGLARGQMDRADLGWTGMVDLGVRVLWSTDRWGASLEGILRAPLGGAAGGLSHRVALVGDYRLLEGTWLTVTVGHGFTGAVDHDGFFALGGLKFAPLDPRQINWTALAK